MKLNKEWQEFHKGLKEVRGFNEKEWEKLNPNLRILIAHRPHISGQGSALFKHIIWTLVDFEKRLKKIESKKSFNGNFAQLEKRVKSLEKVKTFFPMTVNRHQALLNNCVDNDEAILHKREIEEKVIK